MSERERLLPCPFCGAFDDMLVVDCDFADPERSEYVTSYVHCLDCGTDGPRYRARAGAIAAWNRRAQPARDVKELVKRIRCLLIEWDAGMEIHPGAPTALLREIAAALEGK